MTLHIVVVGAGYAGLAAAKLAAKWTNADVTLVNQSERFVERVRLHQLATGQRLRDLPLRELLKGTGVKLVVGRVTDIEPAGRTVRLAHGQAVTYDQLIYALGSQADLDSVPGAAQHAYTVAALDQASRLRERVGESQVVAVAGGGLTGIESAAELAEAFPGLKVRLLTAGILAGGLSPRGRLYLRRTFDRLGIEVRENALVAEVRADGVVLVGGELVGADTVVWTAGFKVSPLARDAGFAVDDRGRMIVDQTLRSVSHPEVSGVGDAAAVRTPDGLELRMACATGAPSAQRAARAIADRLAGRQPRPMRFRYINQCISLGRRDGLIQFVHADDSPRDTVLTGRLAALYKEAIVRGIVVFERHPTLPVSV